MYPKLSSREKEILHLLAHEYNTKEIAHQLYISTHTVTTHRKNLISKMSVRNTAGLVRRAFECGLMHVANAS